MSDVILSDIKKVLGVDPTGTDFNTDIMMHISAAISVLTQLGIGPTDFIVAEDSTWEQFLGAISTYISAKSYVYIKVKLVFDPPPSGYVLDAMTSRAAELEWRLAIIADKALAEAVTP